jgi:Bacterial Ig domain
LQARPDPGRAWQSAIPTEAPTNVGAAYGNVVVVPLQVAAIHTGALPGAPPVASDQTATTDQGTPVTITLTGLDLDTCELGFSIVAPPANGSLEAIVDAACALGTPNSDTATVQYTPTGAFTGSDAFTYRANDGTSDSSTATVSLSVNPLPTATPTPVLTPTPTGATATATPLATPSITASPTAPTPEPTPVDICGDEPASGCRQSIVPRGSLLTLTKGKTSAQNRLYWKWGKGMLTAKSDFGVPTSLTDYGLCVYDGGGTRLLSARVPRGDLCRTNELRPCWLEKSRGYRYVDRELTPDGIQQVLLKAGTTGKAQIVVKGRGTPLALPSLAVMQLPVRVQLVTGNGTCWEATFAGTFKNTATHFKAKSE